MKYLMSFAARTLFTTWGAAASPKASRKKKETRYSGVKKA
ncbi:MAG: hypothetical protein A4E48_01374 [Methanosaeta sp. PtaU1.Bin060]|nr:MAG: hypothetical protein A4E48_01374 [Methanosaeta sp. PtaU1.Bin060]